MNVKPLMFAIANAQLTELAMKNIREDQQGFNSVYMLDWEQGVPATNSSTGMWLPFSCSPKIDCWWW
jgi:hypothetical protein